MQCQYPDCTCRAEPGSLLCQQHRNELDSWVDEYPAPEIVETIWGEMIVGGEG